MLRGGKGTGRVGPDDEAGLRPTDRFAGKPVTHVVHFFANSLPPKDLLRPLFLRPPGGGDYLDLLALTNLRGDKKGVGTFQCRRFGWTSFSSVNIYTF